jgi:hypothetical protein
MAGMAVVMQAQEMAGAEPRGLRLRENDGVGAGEAAGQIQYRRAVQKTGDGGEIVAGSGYGSPSFDMGWLS